MANERNILFLYPLSNRLEELKEELEKDEDITVYEMESSAEFSQLIGILEDAIVFGTDVKKFPAALAENKKFVKSSHIKTFLMQDKILPPHIVSKMRKDGLSEVIQESSSIKTILHKINMFYAPMEAKLRMEEEAKNRSIMSSTVLTDKTQEERKALAQQQNEKLHVEKTLLPEEDNSQELDSSKRKKYDMSSFIGASSQNMRWQSKPGSGAIFNSPFDNLQRRNLTKFDPVNDLPKLKRAKFEPFAHPESRQNNNMTPGLDQGGELKRKHVANIEFTGKQLEKHKHNFKELEKEFDRKRANFKAVETELERKTVDLQNLFSEIEQKKRGRFEEVNREHAKRKTFQETLPELDRKKKKFEEVQRLFERKKLDLDLANSEYEKKKKKFDAVEPEKNRANTTFYEVQTDNKKRHKILNELEELARKKKTLLEEILNDRELKKLHLGPVENQKKKNKFEEEEAYYKKKRGVNLETLRQKKERKGFEPVEYEIPKKKGFIEAEEEDAKNRGRFEELSQDKQRKNLNFDLDKKGRERKTIDEQEKLRKLQAAREIENDDFDHEEDVLNSFASDKDLGEQTIDYRDFDKKSPVEGEFADKDGEEQEYVNTTPVASILEEPELTWYENKSYGLEYLVIHNSFLLQDPIDALSLFKFIHFALMKEYKADISLYLLKPNVDEPQGIDDYICLYSGHRQRQAALSDEDFQLEMREKFSVWKEVRLPSWKDETYQVAINEFVYPYFEDGRYMGLAVSHYQNSVQTHEDAAKVEILFMCLKGTILDEYLKKRSS